MIIDYDEKSDLKFGDLKTGDVFFYENGGSAKIILMKVFIAGSHANAIFLKDGSSYLMPISDPEKVEKLKCELKIYGVENE